MLAVTIDTPDRSDTLDTELGLERSSGKPVLLVVDADETALRRIEGELARRYGADYRVVCTDSAEVGLGLLEECRATGEELALVLADPWLPGMTGAEFLARARRSHPDARRALLMAWGAWSDQTTAEAINRAIALGQADYYVVKPWQSPDESFHQSATASLREWAWARPAATAEVRVIGEPWAPRSHELLDLLERNRVSHAFTAADSPEGRALLAANGRAAARLPVVTMLGGRTLVDPTNLELADAFGVNGQLDWLGPRDLDVLVVGAGPAGLSAAVYAASEGLRTLVLEREAIGGQASSSSLIRNYLGFARGVTGAELARQAYQQARLFGAAFHLMRDATALRQDGRGYVLSLSDGTEVSGRTVVLATGVAYRRLGVPELEALTGAGVYYGAAMAEAPAMAGLEVYVAGGANSAGQAALYLARYAAQVTLLVRGDSLEAGMSEYLIRQIAATDNIAVRLRTEVVGGGQGSGAGRLEHLVLRDKVSGRTETVPAAALFAMIGAEPHTGWLPTELARDGSGYLLTGRDLLRDGRPPAGWPLERLPLPLETSLPGVFAAGDARYRGVKRVASAVGQGAIAVQSIHEHVGHAPTHAAPALERSGGLVAV